MKERLQGATGTAVAAVAAVELLLECSFEEIPSDRAAVLAGL